MDFFTPATEIRFENVEFADDLRERAGNGKLIRLLNEPSILNIFSHNMKRNQIE